VGQEKRLLILLHFLQRLAAFIALVEVVSGAKLVRFA
jgi:hypothetical protein